ncbi:hypothetical protein BDF14DRAFT_1742142 [Spinellus fusiger]|nr:hypothetical protein BDF14DRAFT_1742142 [Spinellus fusiger]
MITLIQVPMERQISQERTVSRPKKKRKHQQEYVTADQVDKEKKSDEKDPSTAPQGLSEYCISSLNISEAIQPETIDLTADSETVDLTAESESSSSTESESYSSRNQKVLFCYPFEGKERSKFLITKSEEMKLQEGEYLNDCLIDFGARRFCDLVSRTNPETIEDTHIFSCYFFSDLLDKADTDNSFCDLRKWTSKVDIFKKKYVIIPVNECYLDEDEDEDSIDYKEGTDEEAFNKV